MIEYAVLMLFCVVFVELFIGLSLISTATALGGVSSASLEAVSSTTLTDHDKEILMRQNSFRLLKLTGLLAVKFVIIAAVLFGVFLLTQYLSGEIARAVADSFTRPLVIVILTAASLLYVWIRNVIIRRL